MEHTQGLNDVHQFDLFKSEFNSTQPLGVNPARNGHTGTLFGAKVLVFGGKIIPIFIMISQHMMFMITNGVSSPGWLLIHVSNTLSSVVIDGKPFSATSLAANTEFSQATVATFTFMILNQGCGIIPSLEEGNCIILV